MRGGEEDEREGEKEGEMEWVRGGRGEQETHPIQIFFC